MRKRIIYILTAFLIMLSVVSCGKSKDDTLTRFEFVETYGAYGDYSFHRIRDVETGVEYILINGYCELSMTPLYDSNGEVVVTKGE